MALSIDTDVVARDIFGLAYSAIDTAKQADVTAAVARAKEKVGQYAQHVDFGDGTDGPSAWDNWAETEAQVILARAHRLERLGSLRELARDAMRSALDSFVSKAFNATTTFGATMTPLGLRQHIAAAAMRGDKPMPLDPLTIDSTIESIVNELWNQTGWHFRRRETTMTIAVNGTVTFDLDPDEGEYFDSFAIRELYYTDTNYTLEHVDADPMYREASQTSAVAGRPRWVRVMDYGSAKAFKFYPFPDAEYTLKAEVFITGPATPANASSTTWLDKFPPEFKTIIRDLATARALGTATNQINDRLGALLPRFSDVHGYLDHNQAPRDVYRDTQHFGPYGSYGDVIGGPL